MKQIKNLALASVLCAGSYVAGVAQQVAPAIPADPAVEQNIRNWLKKMTLEE